MTTQGREHLIQPSNLGRKNRNKDNSEKKHPKQKQFIRKETKKRKILNNTKRAIPERTNLKRDNSEKQKSAKGQFWKGEA